MVSVIIVARNEKYLNKTIEDIRIHADAVPIEVIVLLDGVDQEVIGADKVHLFKEPVGRRNALNYGAKKAHYEYLLFIDAHCTMSDGWDQKMISSCSERALVVSCIDSIDDNFKSKNKGRYGFVQLDQQLKDKWWGKRKPLDECSVEEETMAMTGCGWMIRKQYFLELGGFDESLDKYGHTGTEWSLKVWCHHKRPGCMVLRTDVTCGHVFGTNKDDALYKAETNNQEEVHKIMMDKYGDRIFDLVKKFSPPTWDEVEFTTNVQIKTRTTIDKPEQHMLENADKPWVTCYMLYYGRYALVQEAMECFLAQTYPNKKMLIINTHPDPVHFEEDLLGMGYNIEIQNLPDPDDKRFPTLNHKYDYAFSQVTTEWLAPWDDDDIYLPWHLENLVKNIPNIPSKGIPRRISGRYRYSSRNNIISKFGGRMWGCGMFETFDSDGKVYPRADGQVTVNADRQVSGNQEWDTLWIDQTKYPMSFIYRWGTGESHGSSHTGEKGWTHASNMRKQKNALRLLEPWRPHWRRNYVEDVREFLSTDRETPKLDKPTTTADLLALIPKKEDLAGL